MEFQLLAMNDSVGLLILVVGMAVAVALIALLESKMNAPQPAASVPEERHAPAAAAKAAPAPTPRAPVVETGVPAEVVAAIAAAVACLEGGAATVRGIRRLPRHVRIGLVRLRSAVRRPARRAERGKRADDR